MLSNSWGRWIPFDRPERLIAEEIETLYKPNFAVKKKRRVNYVAGFSNKPSVFDGGIANGLRLTIRQISSPL